MSQCMSGILISLGEAQVHSIPCPQETYGLVQRGEGNYILQALSCLMPIFSNQILLSYSRGVKLTFTGGPISLKVAFKGPNVILGL